ncbi:uncharacterized protein LOC128245602 [Mya arenaria]|uniref:uncharacterized protein LOC128245602 n=1 Tax=Mya arenaria TaxID=6604 RepID=UPI0022E760DC|nr:uncharacterized protein LOC128245602 [Mya arenaria]
MEETKGDKEKPLTFADLGIETVKNTEETCFGKVRSPASLTKIEKAFLILCSLSLVAVIIITIIKMADIPKDDADFTFALLLLINSCITLYYLFSGVFFERPYELIILVISTFIVWIYLVLNYSISVKNDLKLGRLITASVLGPVVLVLGVILVKNYRDSKGLIFRTVGANEEDQNMCNTLYIFLGFLKADLQLSISLAVLVLNTGRLLNEEDKILLPVTTLIGIVTAVCGYLCVRFENKKIAVIYLAMWCLIPAYTIYLIYHAAKDLSDTSDDTQMEIGLYAVLFVTAAASLVVKALSIMFGVRVYRNFGKGLKEKVYKTEDLTLTIST